MPHEATVDEECDEVEVLYTCVLVDGEEDTLVVDTKDCACEVVAEVESEDAAWEDVDDETPYTGTYELVDRDDMTLECTEEDVPYTTELEVDNDVLYTIVDDACDVAEAPYAVEVDDAAREDDEVPGCDDDA
ncbi:hypothetical protein HK405_003593 [Cladochytrium tenue]|nr:hypothetical protein HK405_003593 [Cladochytrium tenue]